MRIIAGTLKGRRLLPPTWTGLRPTSDRLRETLFNIVRGRVEGAVVLDGCAGTGALGLEAISRGAAAVTFVESDRRAAGLIAENLERCGVAGHATIVRAALPDAVSRMPPAATFDLILLDPPYGYDGRAIDAILSAVAPRVRADGQVVLERARRDPASVVAELSHQRRVTSGDSALDFYGRAER